MVEEIQYGELKEHIIESLKQSIEICKESRFKSSIEGLKETLEYVQNECLPEGYNHYARMYHRVPYDIYKLPLVKHLNHFKKDLANTLLLSIFNSGDLIQAFIMEQTSKPNPSRQPYIMDSDTERQLDLFNKRFDEELTGLLLTLKWWDKSIDEIQRLIPLLTCSDLENVKRKIKEYFQSLVSVEKRDINRF